MIGLNRRRVTGGKPLPYGAEIEYLESTGTQWIDTGVILDSNYGIEIKFAPMQRTGSESGIFGSSKEAQGHHNVMQINSNLVALCMPTGTRIASYSAVIGDVKSWQINKENDGKVLIDGVLQNSEIHPNSKTNCPYTVYLFSRNRSGSRGNIASIRVYYYKISTPQSVIIDLIPVRVGQIGYMYDRVSGQLFSNSGTGEFILGPDKIRGGSKSSAINILYGSSVERGSA